MVRCVSRWAVGAGGRDDLEFLRLISAETGRSVVQDLDGVLRLWGNSIDAWRTFNFITFFPRRAHELDVVLPVFSGS